MHQPIFSEELIQKVVTELKITQLENATIGQVVLLAMRLEELTGIPFIRMDQGVPGLPPCKIGLMAEQNALESNIAAIYPAAEGIPTLKNEISRFVKAFLNVESSPVTAIPVTGSVAGSFASFIACSQYDSQKDNILFIDPGFPIQKSQLAILNIPHQQFDVYHFRGEKLLDKLESYLKKGNIAAIVYSNPNNPAWISFTEEELRIIGTLATKYKTIVMEDLAYFGMDFRTPFGTPYQPPYIPTIAHYTDHYILMISASKIFSYAGQRIAALVLSEKLFYLQSEKLAKQYSNAGVFGTTLINSILYMITSGTTHSTQFGFAAMLKASTEGKYDFRTETSEYARRSQKMKDIFIKNGFHIVYDKDIDRAISDGFFFTIGYKNMSCGQLMKALLYVGISSITLSTTGSTQNGIRACCSRINDNLLEILDNRLQLFKEIY